MFAADDRQLQAIRGKLRRRGDIDQQGCERRACSAGLVENEDPVRVGQRIGDNHFGAIERNGQDFAGNVVSLCNLARPTSPRGEDHQALAAAQVGLGPASRIKDECVRRTGQDHWVADNIGRCVDGKEKRLAAIDRPALGGGGVGVRAGRRSCDDAGNDTACG